MGRIKIFNDLYYYHIYNRGVEKRKIFSDKWDYVRFLESMREFNQVEAIGSLYHYRKNKSKLSAPSAPDGALGALSQPLIKILAYCLNPNHYHLLVLQNKENGISKFMQKLGAGYTCYFNEKHNRTGSLCQGKYKAKEITSTHDLMKVSVYVNCNAEIHGIAKAKDWIWSSYLDYIGMRKGTLCDKKDIYEELSAPSASAGALGALSRQYEMFCKEWIGDMRMVKYSEKFDLD